MVASSCMSELPPTSPPTSPVGENELPPFELNRPVETTGESQLSEDQLEMTPEPSQQPSFELIRPVVTAGESQLSEDQLEITPVSSQSNCNKGKELLDEEEIAGDKTITPVDIGEKGLDETLPEANVPSTSKAASVQQEAASIGGLIGSIVPKGDTSSKAKMIALADKSIETIRRSALPEKDDSVDRLVSVFWEAIRKFEEGAEQSKRVSQEAAEAIKKATEIATRADTATKGLSLEVTKLVDSNRKMVEEYNKMKVDVTKTVNEYSEISFIYPPDAPKGSAPISMRTISLLAPGKMIDNELVDMGLNEHVKQYNESGIDKSLQTAYLDTRVWIKISGGRTHGQKEYDGAARYGQVLDLLSYHSAVMPWAHNHLHWGSVFIDNLPKLFNINSKSKQNDDQYPAPHDFGEQTPAQRVRSWKTIKEKNCVIYLFDTLPTLMPSALVVSKATCQFLLAVGRLHYGKDVIKGLQNLNVVICEVPVPIQHYENDCGPAMILHTGRAVKGQKKFTEAVYPLLEAEHDFWKPQEVLTCRDTLARTVYRLQKEYKALVERFDANKKLENVLLESVEPEKEVDELGNDSYDTVQVKKPEKRVRTASQSSKAESSKNAKKVKVEKVAESSTRATRQRASSSSVTEQPAARNKASSSISTRSGKAKSDHGAASSEADQIPAVTMKVKTYEEEIAEERALMEALGGMPS